MIGLIYLTRRSTQSYEARNNLLKKESWKPSPIGSHHRARAILALRTLKWSQFFTADAVGGRNKNISRVEIWFRELDPKDALAYVRGDKIGQAWDALKLYEVTDKVPPSVDQIMEHYGFFDGEIRPVGSGVYPWRSATLPGEPF